jgi:hypothetical protein
MLLLAKIIFFIKQVIIFVIAGNNEIFGYGSNKFGQLGLKDQITIQ